MNDLAGQITEEDAVLAPIPLYSRIKEVLRERILDGTYPVHSKLPSESELMKTFEVSRITVRQALRDLHKEGLTFSIQGKGTFVTKPKAVQELTRLQGFGEAMARKGYETYSKLIGASEVAADEAVARALQLQPRSTVVQLQRVRYLNRSAVSLDVSYFPVEVGRRLLQEDLATRDIFEILENDHAYKLDKADLTIDAIVADRRLAGHLGIQEGSAVLRIERLTHVNNGRPLDFEYLYYAGDAYQYRLRVERG
jgi:GntR family transcriptional regulator